MLNYNMIMQRGSFFWQVIGVMLLLGLVACSAPADVQISTDTAESASTITVDRPAATITVNQNWMTVSKDQAEEMGIASWLVKSENLWTPSANDIMNLEKNLAAYLSHNSHAFYGQPPVWERLDEYQRQYIGLEREGRPIIYGNYFCSNQGKNWRKELVIVDDGGECYFQVEYDVESEKFIMLLVNGVS